MIGGGFAEPAPCDVKDGICLECTPLKMWLAWTVRGMIDRLEIKAERETGFTGRLRDAYASLRRMSSELYKESIDLRQMGINAQLFVSCRYNGTHKLVFRNAANLSAIEVNRLAEQVFRSDPNRLRTARIDCAADVRGVSVKWFREHMRTARKRRFREVTSGTAGTERSRKGTTLYFGVGPDLIRVYEKDEEEAEESSPEESCRQTDSSSFWNAARGHVKTRVERQMRSGRIPSELSTLEGLYKNAAKFDPFAPVVLVPGGKPNPDIRSYRISEYLEGTGLRTLLSEKGFARTWYLVSRRSGGNAARIFRRLADFFPPTLDHSHLIDLTEIYRRSVRSQLSGKTYGVEEAKAGDGGWDAHGGYGVRNGNTTS